MPGSIWALSTSIPLWDGNGRMARLLANLPLLHSGQLPVVIELKDRQR